jgi:hypothetical protein
MRKVLKFTGLGCLGLVGLIVAVGVIAAIVAPPSEAPQGSAPVQKAQEPKPEEPQSPEGPEDYLHVTGTAGIPFSCAVMDGDGSQRTVDGVVPQKIPLKEMGWTATSENSCQKMGAEGTLKVAIVIGGDVKDTNSTSGQYGVVSVGYP